MYNYKLNKNTKEITRNNIYSYVVLHNYSNIINLEV